MIVASERRVTGGSVAVTGANNGNSLNNKHPGISQLLKPKPGRAVKIYVIDPRKFQENLEKYVGDLQKTPESNKSIGANNVYSKNGGSAPKVKVKVTAVPNVQHQDSSGSLSQLTKNNVQTNEGATTAASQQLVCNASTSVQDSGLATSSTTDKSEDKSKRKLTKKKPGKKRKIITKTGRRESIQEEKAEAAELAFLMKQTTTRTGRLSKSSTAAAAAATNPSTTATVPAVGISQPASPTGSGVFTTPSGPISTAPSPSPSLSSVNSQGRVKKREPPEMFRCQTCLKVYLGHTKLNLHFQKFPTHLKSESEVPVLKKKKVVAGSRSRGTGTDLPYLQNQFSTSTNGNFINSNYNNGGNPSTTFSQLTNQLPAQVSTSMNFSSNTFEIQTDPIAPIPLNLPHNNQEIVNNHFVQPSGQIESSSGLEQNYQELVLGRLSSFLSSSLSASTSSTVRSSSSINSIINPDTLSDNCSSPKLPDYNITNGVDLPVCSLPLDSGPGGIFNPPTMDPIFLQANSPLNQNHPEDLQPITVPDMCLPPGEGEGGVEMLSRVDDYYMDFQASFLSPNPSLSQIPSELIGNGSCSQQSFNSLENLLAESSLSPLGQTSSSPLPMSLGLGAADGQLLSTNSFFPTCLPENQAVVHNSSNSNPSSYNNNLSTINGNHNSSIDPGDEESRDVCISSCNNNNNNSNRMDEDDLHGTENSLDGCENEIIIQPSPSSSMVNFSRRSIWEFVKEQIRLCGINQTCGEISEMAEKLSKVARDKFYPIREEEIERMNGNPQIIQVETPFISHLLDLPFGTYIFKEDGGIRKIVPPPTPLSCELSLTNGMDQVDLDKFLPQDISDLNSLPHLTNLDFTSFVS